MWHVCPFHIGKAIVGETVARSVRACFSSPGSIICNSIGKARQIPDFALLMAKELQIELITDSAYGRDFHMG